MIMTNDMYMYIEMWVKKKEKKLIQLGLTNISKKLDGYK